MKKIILTGQNDLKNPVFLESKKNEKNLKKYTILFDFIVKLW